MLGLKRRIPGSRKKHCQEYGREQGQSRSSLCRNWARDVEKMRSVEKSTVGPVGSKKSLRARRHRRARRPGERSQSLTAPQRKLYSQANKT